MNVFGLRDEVITEYGEFVGSFVQVRAEDLSEKVEEHFEGGRLWPQPMLQLNPSFEAGASIEELADEGVLDERCREIFRLDKTDAETGRPLRLHRHQEEAVRAAGSGDHYVLTTGTGSGKSLAYIVPIVDHVLRRGSGRGIQAVVVYPMNALANSQQDELEKFLGPAESAPVRYAAYTGQEPEERRQGLRHNPPDILLTNYVMLELLLTRSVDRPLIAGSPDLRLIVLDELHTYRGRQGSDVAMLVRRVRMAKVSPVPQVLDMIDLLLQKLVHAQLISLNHSREMFPAQEVGHDDICRPLLIQPFRFMYLVGNNSYDRILIDLPHLIDYEQISIYQRDCGDHHLRLMKIDLIKEV